MIQDVLSGGDLSIFAQVALVIFFAAFVAIVVWVIRKPKREVDRQARLPLDDAPPTPPRRSSPADRSRGDAR